MKRVDWLVTLAVAAIIGLGVFLLTYRDAFVTDTSIHAATDGLPATRHLASATLWHSRTRGCYVSVDIQEHETGFVYVPSEWCKALPVNPLEGK